MSVNEHLRAYQKASAARALPVSVAKAAALILLAAVAFGAFRRWLYAEQILSADRPFTIWELDAVFLSVVEKIVATPPVLYSLTALAAAWMIARAIRARALSLAGVAALLNDFASRLREAKLSEWVRIE